MPLVHINPFHLEHLPLDAYPQVIDQAASTFIDGYRQALLTSHIVIGQFLTIFSYSLSFLLFIINQFKLSEHCRRNRTGAKAFYSLLMISGVNINDTEGFSHAIQTAARQFVEEHYSRSGNGENKEEMIATLIEKNENKSVLFQSFYIVFNHYFNLITENFSINLRYSRQCNICLTPSPDTRVTLTACGHLLCMACVLQIEVSFHLNILHLLINLTIIFEN